MEFGSVFVQLSLFVALLVVIGFLSFITLIKFYKRCPPDKILVVFGRVGRIAGGQARSAKCVHGGATFVIPVLQDYQFLDLTPLTIDIDLKSALSKENIRVNAPSTFTVGISSSPEIMNNAAERLLGLSMAEVEQTASDIIFGQFRATIATMKIEEINADREKFQQTVMDNVEDELGKIGLRLINVNIKDVTDESNYLAALGKRAAAEATNKAKIEVAEQERNGSVGEAKAVKERDILVAEAHRDTRTATAQAEAEAVKGEREAKAIEADAESALRVRQASAAALAVKGERDALQIEAAADSDLRIKKAEVDANAAKAERIRMAEAAKEALESEKLTELARKDREIAAKLADTVPDAEAAKQQLIIEAEAQKSQRVIQAEAEKEAAQRRGEGEGLEMRARMENEAKGLEALLGAQAEGLGKIVAAAGGDAGKAFMLMMADKMPELFKMQTEALQNLQIDKVLVMDGGSGDGVSNFVQGFAQALPFAHEIAELGGIKLPGLFMGEQKAEPPQQPAVPEVAEENDPEDAGDESES
ncbi:flotillin family protein [Oceanidesulfovibrio marinus]|uniref:Flotillin family protein n=1 Tax=Oceanidesulfovibrio marinus TaxID=370038 RepID=A0ABX6NIV4_9BACT|nr:flotillin family protein [Oceanidesulfovibrio marinus]QJT09565.1 flotillin family protein [Oceanidesulfovibrio marinus]